MFIGPACRVISPRFTAAVKFATSVLLGHEKQTYLYIYQQLSVVRCQLQLLNHFFNNMKVNYHNFMKLQPSLNSDGVFTLPDTEKDENMAFIGLYGGVHTAQRQITTQIPIAFCLLVIGICLGLGLVLGQCQRTMKWHSQVPPPPPSQYFGAKNEMAFVGPTSTFPIFWGKKRNQPLRVRLH